MKKAITLVSVIAVAIACLGTARADATSWCPRDTGDFGHFEWSYIVQGLEASNTTCRQALELSETLARPYNEKGHRTKRVRTPRRYVAPYVPSGGWIRWHCDWESDSDSWFVQCTDNLRHPWRGRFVSFSLVPRP
jgi:hypothetical protein